MKILAGCWLEVEASLGLPLMGTRHMREKACSTCYLGLQTQHGNIAYLACNFQHELGEALLCHVEHRSPFSLTTCAPHLCGSGKRTMRGDRSAAPDAPVFFEACDSRGA